MSAFAAAAHSRAPTIRAFSSSPSGHQDEELIPSPASVDILGAQNVAQALGYGAEHLIAGGVTEGVVDLLEVVKVDHQDGHRLAAAACSRGSPSQVFSQGAAVEQPGQRIGPCAAG